MRKYLVLFVAVLITAILPTEKASAQVPSAYVAEGDKVVWKIKNVVVSGFPTECALDVYLLSENFNKLYEEGFKLEDLHVDKSDGQWSLFIGNKKIFSISEAYAKSLMQDPEKIALNLLSEIYEVLGAQNADELTSAHQIGGKYETSASVSWYSEKFIGRKCANGERLTRTHLIAAAKTLPFGTIVKVTAPSGKSVVVRITDRFPGYKNRVLDISPAAAALLGIKEIGVPKAKIEILGSVNTIGGK